MPQNLFTTYNSNERDVAIPIVPNIASAAQVAAGATTATGVITLSAANATSGSIDAYIYYLAVWGAATGAASSMAINWAWQFRDAAHANVGAATAIFQLTGGNNGAGIAGVLNSGIFAPAWPFHLVLAIPATAVEIALTRQSIIIGGAPVVTCVEMWGIDLINRGTPGDIGSGGMVAQSTTNPNTF